jgi:phosphoribosylglycinamide formyltransferase 1
VTRARVVVLLSGTGTTLQALLDAAADPAYPAQVVAVGADRPDAGGLARAEQAEVPTFVVDAADHPDRTAWSVTLADAVAEHAPDLVVCAGLMRVLAPDFLARFPDRVVNTHPALLPSFPGAHAVVDALAYGVKVSGCTVHLVDAGIDTGPVVAQATVPVLPDDDEASLHERIKRVERVLLVRAVAHLVTTRYQVVGRQLVSPPQLLEQ